MPRDVELRSLYVIQSLKAGDPEFGVRLVNDVLLPAVARSSKSVTVKVSTPVTAAEMLQELDEIAREVDSQDGRPLIHITVHGNESLIETTNGDRITWKGLAGALTQVNVACTNNLTVVMAACKGRYLERTLRPTSRAPVWRLVGCRDDIDFVDADPMFGAFYAEYLATQNVETAVAALNAALSSSTGKAAFVPAFAIFAAGYRRFAKEKLDPASIEAWAEELASKAEADFVATGLPSPGRSMLKERVLAALQNQEDFFTKFRDRYFMNDLAPENRARFPIRFADVT